MTNAEVVIFFFKLCLLDSKIELIVETINPLELKFAYGS